MHSYVISGIVCSPYSWENNAAGELTLSSVPSQRKAYVTSAVDSVAPVREARIFSVAKMVFVALMGLLMFGSKGSL